MTTYPHAVSSLDGYVADDNDDVGPLHDWYGWEGHPPASEHVVVVSHRPKPNG